MVAQLAVATPLVLTAVQPVPEINALFEQTNNWIGADGDYSVALASNRTLWLFSDTWVGNIRLGKRVNVTMVNNSMAMQDGKGPDASLKFFVRHNVEGKPVAIITPENGRGWFWLQSGVCVDRHLYLFLMQVERSGTNSDGAFGFRQIGEWLGTVTNYSDSPLHWHVVQQRLPCANFTSESQMSFGAATLLVGDDLYVYGTRSAFKDGNWGRQLIVARVHAGEVVDPLAWKYYENGLWQTDSQKATGIADGLATECSVSFLPGLKQYVLIYTDHGLSPDIELRTALRPWGEWSAPTTVYSCPETEIYTNVFCYAAKAHPSLANGDQIMISYAVNAYSVWQVLNDAGLYWPRFVRAQLSKADK
jgi:hypothetical protein